MSNRKTIYLIVSEGSTEADSKRTIDEFHQKYLDDPSVEIKVHVCDEWKPYFDEVFKGYRG